MSTAVQLASEHEPVFLRPRPYARFAGVLILVPLLLKKPPLRPLPAEAWTKVLSMAIGSCDNLTHSERAKGKGKATSGWELTLVCKMFKDLALPLLYNSCTISSISSLREFTSLLHGSDQKWDSIRRIPYSTPGRWVQSLDLSQVVIATRSELYAVDSLLTTLFPLLPFLARLELSLSVRMSKRAMGSLAARECSRHIRTLKGIKCDALLPISGLARHGEDPLTQLIACCEGLEELEVLGPGLEDVDIMEAPPDTPPPTPPPPLFLPRLHTLTLLSMPSSNLLLRLIHSPLPSLHNLVITPYGDLPSPITLVSQFLLTHGSSIRTLILHTPKAWPTTPHPAPPALLLALPRLAVLSLEHPLPALTAPVAHPLETLWIPRPTAQFRAALERTLPRLPALREVRARDLRWAPRGLSVHALEAGFQGEMRSWRRMLAARGARMLDADGREADV